uniref:Uncharacterized protein n=1 Tax=Geospiza parvula TaxID=87175 RepID=A0A8C3Q6E2_GEOPR
MQPRTFTAGEEQENMNSRTMLGKAALCRALLYPLLPACYKVFRGKPKIKRDYSASNSHAKCLSGPQVFTTLILMFLVTSHEQWWKSLESYPRRQLH